MVQSTCIKSSIQVDQILPGKLDTYRVQEFLGEGVYGRVAQCIKINDHETMAVKILRKRFNAIGKKEVVALKELRKLDASKNNMVRFIENFYHQGYFCLVFEMLDISLFDFLKVRSFIPLCMFEVRLIIQQMLVALSALKSIGWTHGDIKPDNIMLVDHQSKPFQVKLIDFGMASPVSKLKLGTKIQAIGYRAPEVMLGLNLSEAIDIWSLGCVMAFLYMGRHLFPVRSEYESMRIVVKMQGQPGDDLLDCGVHSRELFTKDSDDSSLSWRLKTKEEYKLSTGCTVKPCSKDYECYNSLDDIALSCKEDKHGADYEDALSFLSLLKRMLHQNCERRIKPSEALGHHFITLKNFSDDTESSYVPSSTSTIKSCNTRQSSLEFQPYSMLDEMVSLKEESPPLLCPFTVQKEIDADTNKDDQEPPASKCSPVTPEVSPKENPPVEDKTPSPAAVPCDSPVFKIDSDKSVVFVEVKCRRKWLKRVRTFFSRMIIFCKGSPT